MDASFSDDIGAGGDKILPVCKVFLIKMIYIHAFLHMFTYKYM
jgi:hypothetical protein